MTFIFQNFGDSVRLHGEDAAHRDHVLVDRIIARATIPCAPLSTPRRSPRRHHRLPQAAPRTPTSIWSSAASAFRRPHPTCATALSTSTEWPRTSPTPDAPDDGDPSDAYIPYRDELPLRPRKASSRLPSQNNASLLGARPAQPTSWTRPHRAAGAVLLGRHRTQSLDGRFWGSSPREHRRRPLFVYWSFLTPPTRSIRPNWPTAWPSWDTSSSTSSPRPAGTAPSTSSASSPFRNAIDHFRKGLRKQRLSSGSFLKEDSSTL